jgi:putative ABC transport system permease protein
VLTDRLADILHARAGDVITMIPVKGERRPVQVPVAQVAQTYFGLAAYADIEYLSRVVHGEFTMTGAQLAVHEPERETLYRALKQTPAVQSVAARQDMIDNLVQTLVQNQYVFIGILVLFSGIVFFGSVVNSSLVGLAERQREVAMLRAMGYGPWDVGGLFLRENLVVNAVGTLWGLPFGYGLVALTSLAYEQNDLIRLPVVSAPWVWVTTIALSLLFALFAHGVVQWRLHRLDVLEALNVRE